MSHTTTGWSTTLATFVAAAVGLGVFAGPSRAEACGGFFCNRQQPVEQSAEQIVFADNGDGTVTAIVQIKYQGPSEKFAWLLPMPGKPDVGVSSSTVFSRLDRATRPQYRARIEEIKGECRRRRRFASGAGGGGADAAAAGRDAGTDRGVQVVDEGAVGPYQYTTISVADGADDPAKTALNWLKNHGYDLTDIGPGLIRQYLNQGLNLIAFKLKKHTPSGEIRPVKLTYSDSEPMIPIKLTAVAAKEDMGVLVWVLGEHRAVPKSYKQVELNPAAVDWFNPQSNYDEVVTAAADEAGSRAFVTEYADESSEIEDSVFNEGNARQWKEFVRDDWKGREGRLLISSLRQFGRWDGIQRVVRKEVPLPEGEDGEPVTASEFMQNPLRYYDGSENDIQGFEPQSYLDTLKKNVVEPVRKGEKLVQSRPYLTRLYTTLSPDEMTVDPRFDFNAQLGDVGRRHVARLTLYCNPSISRREAPWKAVLPDGTVVWGKGRDWPLGPGKEAEQQVPASKKVRKASTTGKGELVQDNSKTIETKVEKHNESTGFDRPPNTSGGTGCGCGAAGDRPNPAPWALFVGLVFGASRLRRRRRGER
ncbi:MAG: DUF2330 domain-containing protein [Bradymonadaceae bacterium]